MALRGCLRGPVCIHRYRSAYDYTIATGSTVANRTNARAEAERKAIAARRAQQRGLMVRGFRRHQADDEIENRPANSQERPA